jgi:hypothetical protein
VKIKYKKGMIGVVLALFYVNTLLTFVLTLDFLLNLQIKSVRQYSYVTKSYYAARSGIEHAIASIDIKTDGLSTPSDTIPYYTIPFDFYTNPSSAYNMGTIQGGVTAKYKVAIMPAHEYTQYNELLLWADADSADVTNPLVGNRIYMLSSTGEIYYNSNLESIKSIQAIYYKPSSSTVGKVIAWREVYSEADNAHRFLANH